MEKDKITMGHVKSVTVEGDDLYIDVVGIPYGGPTELNGKDLEGEYFSKSTDLGPLTRVLSYISHAQDDPELPPDFAKSLVGVADQIGETEEGKIYRILVNRDYKYKNVVRKLADANMWRSSSVPYQRTVEINSKTGHIDRWHVVELGLTITAMNPNARQIFLKSLQEIDEMAEDVNKDQTPPVTPPVDPVTPPTENQDSVAKQLDEILANAEKSLAKNVDARLATFEKSLSDVTEKLAPVEEIKKTLNDLKPALEAITQLKADIADLKIAVPKLGKAVADHIVQQTADNKQKSAAELAAEEELRKKGQTPANTTLPNPFAGKKAPGTF